MRKRWCVHTVLSYSGGCQKKKLPMLRLQLFILAFSIQKTLPSRKQINSSSSYFLESLHYPQYIQAGRSIFIWSRCFNANSEVYTYYKSIASTYYEYICSNNEIYQIPLEYTAKQLFLIWIKLTEFSK